MDKIKNIIIIILQVFSSGKDWSKVAWPTLRSLLVSALLKSVSKLTGPIGWIATYAVPLVVDSFIKPVFGYAKRKINKARNKKKGTEKAKDIRDASTDDIDNIYDNINK